MAIQTRIKRSYTLRMVIIGIVCIAFGAWGAYDFFVRYPGDNAHFDEYKLKEAEFQELDKKRSEPGGLSPEELERFDAAKAFMDANPEQPTQHSQLNIWFQWVYISCLPCGLWILWAHAKLMKKAYVLGDDGSLATPEASVPAAEIRDIDMSKWMAKSIAWVETTDNRRIKLDDYVHQNMHLIVGALAHQRYPDQWHEDARQVKVEEPLPAEEAEPAGDAEAASAEPAADPTEAGSHRAD